MEQIREGVWSRVPNEEAEVVRDPDIFDGLIETLARVPDFQSQRWFNRPIRTYYVLMLLHRLDFGIHAWVIWIKHVFTEVLVLNESADRYARCRTGGLACMAAWRCRRDLGEVRVVHGVHTIMPVFSTE